MNKIILIFIILSILSCYSPVIFVQYSKNVTSPGRKLMSELDEYFDYEDIRIVTKDGYTINNWLFYPIGYKINTKEIINILNPNPNPSQGATGNYLNIYNRFHSWVYDQSYLTQKIMPDYLIKNRITPNLKRKNFHKLIHSTMLTERLMMHNPLVREEPFLDMFNLYFYPETLIKYFGKGKIHSCNNHISKNNLEYYIKNLQKLPVVKSAPQNNPDTDSNIEKAKKEKVIIIFHGNAGNIGHLRFYIQTFRQLGYFVLLVEYRGYGKSTGKPSENGLYLDAEASYDWLTQNKSFTKERIYSLGISLGASIALELGLRRDVNGIIIDSAFTSVKDMYQAFLNKTLKVKNSPNILLCLYILSSAGFKNDEKIRKINTPLLVIHGSDDNIAPLWMGKQLYNLANEPKEMEILQGGGHASTCCDYYKKIDTFIKKQDNN